MSPPCHAPNLCVSCALQRGIIPIAYTPSQCQVEQMKKAKAKKAGGAAPKKDDAAAPAAEPSPSLPEDTTPGAAAADEDSAIGSPTLAQPSLAQQSKARSTSFRQGSGSVVIPGPLSPGAAASGPFSPEGETAPDIYRKHVVRIEELERENKRFQKEAADAEKRWQKAEEELADLREVEGEGGEGEGGRGGIRGERSW